MTLPLSSDGRWLIVATFEVEQHVPLAAHLQGKVTDFLLQPSPSSPPGYTWIDVYVDSTLGMQHAARIAHAVLTELAASELAGYRIVVGAQYLDIGATDGETAHPTTVA